ncbi:MAG: hypothetical protein Kow0089_12170 [Desulfobulbaceae bacterium]
MRARLGTMAPGEEFHFLCSDLMAEKMDRVVSGAGGEIFRRDVRGYGVVISIRKTSAS